MEFSKYECIKYLDAEINRNKKALEKIKQFGCCPDLVLAYSQLLQVQNSELLKRKIDAENEINNISNDSARLIAKMRYIDVMTWEDIGKELHYDRTAVYKQLKRYEK